MDAIRSTGYVFEGDQMFGLESSDNEIAGMLELLRAQRDVEVVPLLASRWNSSAVVSADTYRELKQLLLHPLRQAGRVDGVLLSCHGSMVAADADDVEGDLLQAIRQLLGTKVPIAMTLDLHANVTTKMARLSNVLIGYEHYPHTDARRTGFRAAELLLSQLRGDIDPVMTVIHVPMLVPAFNASTEGDGPFARLMARAKSLESRAGVLSTSLFFVGSYIDVPEIACTVVVISDDNQELAQHLARDLARDYWRVRREFLVLAHDVADAVHRGRKIEGGPILLLDTADTTGGGAAGDSIALVRELIRIGVTEPCLAMVVDPTAAGVCTRAGVGSRLTVDVGHRIDPKWGTSLEVTGTVVRVCNGRFRYSGGVFGGTEGSMGASVVLQIGSISLLIQSQPSYEWGQEQYVAAELDPSQAKFVGVKNMMNFRKGYLGIAKAHFVLNLPGPTPPDFLALPVKRARRPWFPLDDQTIYVAEGMTVPTSE